MRNVYRIILPAATAVMMTIAIAGCAGEPTPQEEYQSVIESMIESFTALSNDLDAAEDPESAVDVLESYTGDIPRLNRRFSDLQEKYPDAQFELFQEDEDFAAALSELEDANMLVIQSVIELDDRYGENEEVKVAAWGYIQSLGELSDQE